MLASLEGNQASLNLWIQAQITLAAKCLSKLLCKGNPKGLLHSTFALCWLFSSITIGVLILYDKFLVSGASNVSVLSLISLFLKLDSMLSNSDY